MESIPRFSRDESTTVYYGNSENPKYNIISYTWGRWEDPDHGEAIQVTGPDRSPLEWRVPKVNPERAFGAEDFKCVLRKAANGLDYVWLDVACINQNPRAPEYVAEIGRQAAIFSRAQEGYIWLHQTTGSQLRDSLRLMVSIRDEGQQTKSGANQHLRYRHDIKQREADCKTVNCILQDPWFSSLWTLQEAYIKKDAIFLSKEGRTIDFSDQPLTILALAALCTEVFPWIWQTTKTLIKSAGLNQLQAPNPLVLLGVSSKRTTQRTEDRIYGIMQVFGLKLGSAAVGHHDDVYSLPELEKQLSQQLATDMPTLSQMFLHKDQPVAGREVYHMIGTQTPDRHFARYGATRPGLDLTMFVPEEFWQATQVEPSCRFTFGQQDEVRFRGTLLSLAEIVRMWVDKEGEPESVPVVVYPDEGKTPEMNRFNRSLWLDHFSGVEAEGVMPVADLNLASFTRPVVMAKSMVTRYYNQFHVVVLGRIRDGNDDDDDDDAAAAGGDEVHAGLLVRESGGRGWYRRVGFCTWLGEVEGEELEGSL